MDRTYIPFDEEAAKIGNFVFCDITFTPGWRAGIKAMPASRITAVINHYTAVNKMMYFQEKSFRFS
jgi:hypothetical protein